MPVADVLEAVGDARAAIHGVEHRAAREDQVFVQPEHALLVDERRVAAAGVRTQVRKHLVASAVERFRDGEHHHPDDLDRPVVFVIEHAAHIARADAQVRAFVVQLVQELPVVERAPLDVEILQERELVLWLWVSLYPHVAGQC
jgi:hypothetical protein